MEERLFVHNDLLCFNQRLHNPTGEIGAAEAPPISARPSEMLSATLNGGLKPRASVSPVPIGGAWRDVKGFGGLVARQAGEVA